MVSKTVSTKPRQTEGDAEVEEAVVEAYREEADVDGQSILLPQKCKAED